MQAIHSTAPSGGEQLISMEMAREAGISGRMVSIYCSGKTTLSWVRGTLSCEFHDGSTGRPTPRPVIWPDGWSLKIEGVNADRDVVIAPERGQHGAR